MDIDPKELQKMVEYIEQTQPLIKKQAAAEDSVKNAVPTLVDSLVKRGWLEATLRDKAIASFQDPLALINSFKKVAEAKNEQSAPAPIGKSASANKTGNDDSVTVKKSSEADRKFLEAFNLV